MPSSEGHFQERAYFALQWEGVSKILTKGHGMSKNMKRTSSSLGSMASNNLRSSSSSKTLKQLSASALAQTKTSKQTGAEMERKASKVLRSNKYGAKATQLAASLVSQSNKKRGGK